MKVKKIGTVGMILLFGTTSMIFGEGSDTSTKGTNISVENRVAVEKNMLEKKDIVIPKDVKSNSITEDEIMKALGGIETIQVMKSAKPKIVSESEPMVLSADRPKVIKKRRVTQKHKVTKYKRRVKRAKVTATEMDDLPMAKSYPMNYDVSKIIE